MDHSELERNGDPWAYVEGYREIREALGNFMSSVLSQDHIVFLTAIEDVVDADENAENILIPIAREIAKKEKDDDLNRWLDRVIEEGKP